MMEKQVYPELQETVFRETLPNGMPIAVVARPDFTKKLVYFVTDYGAVHTEFSLEGEKIQAPAGIAHYLEHKLFDMPDRDVSAEFAALGASVNAFTGYDLTAYYFTCTQNFTQCLKLLLEFVSTPYFTQQSVDKEQGIIGQEIGMHADSPDARVFENLMTAMYENHSVRVPILGTQESISRITPELLRQCHQAFYRPKNMFLCVVGDVDPAEVSQIARQLLPVTDQARVTVKRQWQETMTCPSPFTRENMEVAMPTFQLGFKCEPPENGEQAVFWEAVGDLAAEALFGESSQLYLRLYEDGIIDGSFGGGFETVDNMALLTASGDSENPEAVRAAILQQAEKIAREGIPQPDFLRMKRSALGRRIRDLDSFDSIAFRLCAYHFSGFDYFRFPQIYRKVEIGDIQEFLRRVVTPQRCSLSVIYPNQEV